MRKILVETPTSAVEMVDIDSSNSARGAMIRVMEKTAFEAAPWKYTEFYLTRNELTELRDSLNEVLLGYVRADQKEFISFEDDLIDEYSELLADVYDKRTAGDYTFGGILSEFLRKYEAGKK